MMLEKRNMDILLEILRNTKVNTPLLLKKFKISRNQLDYAIKKINSEIEEEGFQPITRTKKGSYYVDPQLSAKYQIASSSVPEEETVLLKEQERSQIICLLIFCSRYISLFHFTDELQVSKNTILKDIKKINSANSKDSISIEYTRKNGYYFEGSEENIRKFILTIINDLLLAPYGETLIRCYLSFLEERLAGISQGVISFEAQIATKFTDKVRIDAPFMLAILLERIDNGFYLSESLGITFQDLSDTREYQALNHFFDSEKLQRTFQNIPENEKLYLTLVMLSLKVTDVGRSFSVNTLALKSAIESFVTNFERNAAIQLADKERIINSLLVHMKSAIYRIKYQLTTSYPYSEAMADEIRPLLDLVRISIQPIEEFLQARIQDNELFYITSFFSAHLFCSEKKSRTAVRKQGIIVCHSGVITSRILEMKLSQALPMIHFDSALSIADFLDQQNIKSYDYIFSPSPIPEAKGKVILVDDTRFEESKDRIVAEVLNEHHYSHSLEQKINQLIDKVRAFGVLEEQDIRKLRTDFAQILASKKQPDADESAGKNKIPLSRYLDESSILFADAEVDSWRKVLQTGTRSLMDRGIVNEAYFTALYDQYPEIRSNIVLGKTLLIPHTSPDHGVIQAGMALVHLKNDIVCDLGTFKLVVVIAAVRDGKHIPAMLQLLAISKDKEMMASLHQAKSPEEITEAIHRFEYQAKKDKAENTR